MLMFIDTNVFLTFYHFSNDDLEELRKLRVLLEREEVVLYLPQQVVEEFWRNREGKIFDALKNLRSQKLSFTFPQFCKDYEEYQRLRQLQRHYAQKHAQLIDKVVADIRSHSLKADMVIQELFDNALHLSIDEQTWELARRRIEVGNPPGKRGSLGDALNWEVLLKYVPEREDLYFITDDKDFKSPLDEDSFNEFLLMEWQQKKGSNLKFYKSMSSFFRDHFPNISLASELEKDLLIRDLANSSSFAETHGIIAKLRNCSEFSMSQVNAIVQAAISNNQVYWIINDEDVREFLTGVISGKEEHITPENLAELRRLLGDAQTPDMEDAWDEIPF